MNALMSFTYNYSQPEEYHFSLDSIHAAKSVADRYAKEQKLEDLQVLDLCAGCGVMAFELSYHLPMLKKFDLVEIQSIYHPHFKKNLETIHQPSKVFNWLEMNYEQLLSDSYKEKYDLIISNPPYFRMGQGKMSPSEFKNRCRFYLDSTFEKLIEAILFSLKPKGQAFVLIRSLEEHGWNLIDELKIQIGTFAEFQIVENIRGTELVQIKK